MCLVVDHVALLHLDPSWTPLLSSLTCGDCSCCFAAVAGQGGQVPSGPAWRPGECRAHVPTHVTCVHTGGRGCLSCDEPGVSLLMKQKAPRLHSRLQHMVAPRACESLLHHLLAWPRASFVLCLDFIGCVCLCQMLQALTPGPAPAVSAKAPSSANETDSDLASSSGATPELLRLVSGTCVHTLLDRRAQAASNIAFIPDLMDACRHEHANLCEASGPRALECLADNRCAGPPPAVPC